MESGSITKRKPRRYVWQEEILIPLLGSCKTYKLYAKSRKYGLYCKYRYSKLSRKVSQNAWSQCPRNEWFYGILAPNTWAKSIQSYRVENDWIYWYGKAAYFAKTRNTYSNIHGLQMIRTNSSYEERRAAENETKRILRGRVGRM